MKWTTERKAKLIEGIATMQAAADALSQNPTTSPFAQQLRDEVRTICGAGQQLPAMAGDDLGQVMLAEPAVDLAMMVLASAGAASTVKLLHNACTKWRKSIEDLISPPSASLPPGKPPKGKPSLPPAAAGLPPAALARHLLGLARTAFTSIGILETVKTAADVVGPSHDGGGLSELLHNPFAWAVAAFVAWRLAKR